MRELKLTPMSELYTDIQMIIDNLEKDSSNAAQLGAKAIKMIQKHIDDQNYLINERIEIELAVIHGKSGVYDSGSEYFDMTYLNGNNAFD